MLDLEIGVFKAPKRRSYSQFLPLGLPALSRTSQCDIRCYYVLGQGMTPVTHDGFDFSADPTESWFKCLLTAPIRSFDSRAPCLVFAAPDFGLLSCFYPCLIWWISPGTCVTISRQIFTGIDGKWRYDSCDHPSRHTYIVPRFVCLGVDDPPDLLYCSISADASIWLCLRRL